MHEIGALTDYSFCLLGFRYLFNARGSCRIKNHIFRSCGKRLVIKHYYFVITKNRYLNNYKKDSLITRKDTVMR